MSDGKTKPIDLKLLTADTVKLEHVPLFPRMTGWFNPKLLGKLLLNVVVSDLFGQYADRRLNLSPMSFAMALRPWARPSSVPRLSRKLERSSNPIFGD